MGELVSDHGPHRRIVGASELAGRCTVARSVNATAPIAAAAGSRRVNGRASRRRHGLRLPVRRGRPGPPRRWRRRPGARHVSDGRRPHPRPSPPGCGKTLVRSQQRPRTHASETTRGSREGAAAAADGGGSVNPTETSVDISALSEWHEPAAGPAPRTGPPGPANRGPGRCRTPAPARPPRRCSEVDDRAARGVA